ncbi:type II secretion system protein [Ruficoccus sp. ZRK36]|uniref:type II secretion system protein n=1 Tax=Ruficoccus sp. ZRK36 TaxID=2866311 RepID=UPI001C72B4D3|nr:type II secretion system protein [Ruficoccus sp. ZRK36]QYY35012.1 type II secretion system GspH family protein [Ruficoccus sp. ZRK36]
MRIVYRGGFTLVECLAVIAVIGLLALLIIPLTQRVRLSAQKTEGTSNLRQVGLAIGLYANANGGYLPGPLRSGQKPWYYRNADEPQLAYLTASYLGLPDPISYPAKNPYFLTDRWESVQGNMARQAPSYLINDLGGPAQSPWGYPTYIYRQSKPVHVIEDPSSTWAIKDLDKENANDAAGWYSTLPDGPIYGDGRNVLYFDWHVEFVPVE